MFRCSAMSALSCDIGAWTHPLRICLRASMVKTIRVIAACDQIANFPLAGVLWWCKGFVLPPARCDGTTFISVRKEYPYAYPHC
jgi:hypothetical protein